MIVLSRFELPRPNHLSVAMPAFSWDRFYLALVDVEHVERFRDVLAFVSDAFEHVCFIRSRIHSVSGDGTVSPSYVCPIAGCGFHEFIQLEGWARP